MRQNIPRDLTFPTNNATHERRGSAFPNEPTNEELGIVPMTGWRFLLAWAAGMLGTWTVVVTVWWLL